ncbi:MAG: rhomboid family intramembrane serine protease [Lachnospiraceae bacterium]|nr:rhomboid family intramembrane serine protease [Lachnospiraceae bacterium]
MKNHNNRIGKIKNWSKDNIIAIALVLLFYFIYIASLRMENAYFCFGTTGMAYMNGEYYRFLTCLFLHSSPRHLLANTLGLLSVSSLLSRFPGKGKTIFLFLFGGVLAEIAWSVVISDQIYDIGASSGIFALLACLLVCLLRFPEQFHFKWYRPDVVIAVMYFVFANSSSSSFLVHTFGFAAGILLSFFMILAGAIKVRPQ